MSQSTPLPNCSSVSGTPTLWCGFHTLEFGGPWLGSSHGSCWGALHASHDRSSFLSESRHNPPLGQPYRQGCLRPGRQGCPGLFLGLFSALSLFSLFNSPAPFTLPSCLTKPIRHFPGCSRCIDHPCGTPVFAVSYASVVVGRAESSEPLGLSPSAAPSTKPASIRQLLPDPHGLSQRPSGPEASSS